jgi:hypothetical protein
MKMFKNRYVLMAEAGNNEGSAGATDRGDDVHLPAAGTFGDDSKAAMEAEAAAAAEEAEALAAAAGGRARDEQGKFAKKDKDDEGRIPKDRFNEAVGKERAAREAAEARATAAEARVRKEETQADVSAITAEIKKMNAEYAKQLMDGEDVKAADTMDKIQNMIEYRAEQRTQSSMAAATTQAVEQVRWDAAVASLEASYPSLNPESEEYDQDLTDIVIAEQHRLMQTQGMIASKALTTAANKIVVKFMRSSTDGVEGAKGLAAGGAKDRKEAQVSKNLDAARRQPGSMAQSGKDSDKAGEGAQPSGPISKEDFAALPEATKAKMRGDFI